MVVGMGLGWSGLMLLTGCPGAEMGNGGNEENEGPAEMRVTRFDVGAGEVQVVSSNLRIIAAEGMTIEGDLMVDPSEGGDLELVAETGNIIVHGRILGMDANAHRWGQPLRGFY